MALHTLKLWLNTLSEHVEYQEDKVLVYAVYAKTKIHFFYE